MSAQADNTRVEIGLGLDSRLGLSAAQLRDLAPLAKELGYQSLWTNAGTDYAALWHSWQSDTVSS